MIVWSEYFAYCSSGSARSQITVTGKNPKGSGHGSVENQIQDQAYSDCDGWAEKQVDGVKSVSLERKGMQDNEVGKIIEDQNCVGSKNEKTAPSQEWHVLYDPSSV